MLMLRDLQTAPPDDHLERLLAPVRRLATRDDLPESRDPDLLQNDLLLAFHPDGSPTWWPLNRPDRPWSPKERRRVLQQRLRENLPDDLDAWLRHKSNVPPTLDILRRIAYEAASLAPGILD